MTFYCSLNENIERFRRTELTKLIAGTESSNNVIYIVSPSMSNRDNKNIFIKSSPYIYVAVTQFINVVFQLKSVRKKNIQSVFSSRDEQFSTNFEQAGGDGIKLK